MSRRINFISIGALSVLFLFFLYVHYSFISPPSTNNDYYNTNNRLHKDEYRLRVSKTNRPYYNTRRSSTNYGNSGFPQNWTATIEDVLNKQRKFIDEEMQYFEYPGGRFGIDAEKLTELTPETNGMPVRSLILTTWRSGSTFLGDILNAMPANYYHYEPLLEYDITRIRGPPKSRGALDLLTNLLKCNYSDLDSYLEFGQTHSYLFSHNNRLWMQCKQYPHLCYESKFLTPFCKLFPLQSLKTVRLKLELASELMDDER